MAVLETTLQMGRLKAYDPTAKNAAYEKGKQAIAAAFPRADYQGDIKLFFSTIQSLSGGDIEMLAPGGPINVGLTTAFADEKPPDKLGVIVQQQVNIAMLARGDVQVNRSRVFTLDSGDITIWSSYGNIDAGRGAKSALSAPLPVKTYDSQGNVVVTFPPAVSGSGIRAQSGSGSGKVGNVILAAPKGVVDASEAGIGGNNVTIAATAVVNASNIQATGVTTGVQQAQAVVPPPASAGNSLAAATDAADSMVQDQSPRSQESSRSDGAEKESRISAQVLGFGECSIGDVKSGRKGCGD